MCVKIFRFFSTICYTSYILLIKCKKFLYAGVLQMTCQIVNMLSIGVQRTREKYFKIFVTFSLQVCKAENIFF